MTFQLASYHIPSRPPFVSVNIIFRAIGPLTYSSLFSNVPYSLYCLSDTHTSDHKTVHNKPALLVYKRPIRDIEFILFFSLLQRAKFLPFKRFLRSHLCITYFLARQPFWSFCHGAGFPIRVVLANWPATLQNCFCKKRGGEKEDSATLYEGIKQHRM